MPERIPLLVIGDDPDMTTGLGRISRDLLTILNGPKFKDVLEVGALGCGAQEDRKDWPLSGVAHGHARGVLRRARHATAGQGVLQRSPTDSVPCVGCHAKLMD